MIKYNVYFKETRIGIILVDMTQVNSYSYKSDQRAIEKLEKEGNYIISEAKTDQIGKPIRFFEDRINDCKNHEIEGVSNIDYSFVKDNSSPR